MSNFVTDEHLNFIYEQIGEACEDILHNDVAPKIERMQRKSIQEFVYGVYPNPKVYVRRERKKGGLLWGVTSKTNRTRLEGEAEISIYNKAKGFKKDLPMLIEYGHKASGYVYDYPRKGRAYVKARPFMQETFDKMITKYIAEKTLVKGLKKRFGNARLSRS